MGEISFPRLEHSVTSPETVRDLVVESVQAIPIDDQGIPTEDARYFYKKDEKFQLRVTIKNNGNQSTSVEKLELYHSTSIEPDTWLKLPDVVPKTKIVVTPNRTEEVTVSDIDPPEDNGTYYYRVCVKVTDWETDEKNNCSTVKIEVGLPDLAVTEVRAEPSTVVPGGEIKLSAKVSQFGSKSEQTVLWHRFYGAKGNDNTSSFEELRASRIDPLPQDDGNNEVKKEITVTAPKAIGTYFYRVSVDSVDGEEKIYNNSAIVRITVGRPDLEIESVEASLTGEEEDRTSDMELNPGDEIYLHVRFKNKGTHTSEKTRVIYYQSANDSISETDKRITRGAEVSLSGNKVVNRTTNDPIALTTPGIYYFGVYVENVPNENDTTNNWSDSTKVVRVIVRDKNGHFLTLPKNLITEVAFGANSTFFVLNPQFAIVDRNNRDYFHHRCIITLNIPGTEQQLNLNFLDNSEVILPEKLPYIMIPIETPKEKVEAAAKQVDEARNQATAALVDGIFNTLIGFIPGGAGTVIGILSTIGNISSEFMQVGELKEELTDEILSQLASPKIVVSDYSGFIEKTNETPQRLPNPILFMIPSYLKSIEIELEQQFYSKDGLVKIRFKDTGHFSDPWYKVGVKLPFSREINLVRTNGEVYQLRGTKLTAVLRELIEKGVPNSINLINRDRKEIIQKLEDLYKVFSLEPSNFYSSLIQSALEGTFFNIFNNLFHSEDPDALLKVTDLPYSPASGTLLYAGIPKITQYRGSWNLAETFQMENAGMAAPRARQMSLVDYPPFQQLSPDMQEYLLQLAGEDNLGKTMTAEFQPIPEETTLLTNYPNPFNPETWIPYQLAKPADVKITIYAADGKLVRTIDLGYQPAGMYQNRNRAAHWDGKNAVGEAVASGVYFYTLTAGEFSATRKMLIRK